MFGIPAAFSNPALLTAGRKPSAPDPMINMIARGMKANQPQQPSRWTQVLQGIGATLQDVGASYDGRQTGAVSRFQQANAAMRQSQDEARRRQLRFEQLRQTVPETDRQFWEAYALGGEEAAMAVRQSRIEAENQTHRLGPNDIVTDSQGRTIASNIQPDRPEPTTLMRNAQAAGLIPGTPEFENFIRNQLTRQTNPTIAGMIAPIFSHVMQHGADSLPANYREAWQMYLQATSGPPSAFEQWLMGEGGGQPGASASPAGNDPLGLRGQ